MVHGWRVCPEPRSSLRLPSADVKAPRHVGTKATAAAAARWRLTRPLPARSAPAERPTEPTHSREDAREHAHRHDQVERVHVACVRHNIVDVPRGAAAAATQLVDHPAEHEHVHELADAEAASRRRAVAAALDGRIGDRVERRTRLGVLIALGVGRISLARRSRVGAAEAAAEAAAEQVPIGEVGQPRHQHDRLHLAHWPAGRAADELAKLARRAAP
mmetsp:Transcript_12398/g.36357  ORF Transcript_12398/g.36357 Transcript_12398/m.36357 type:complete len:217 (+) Transcript_12398:111-761(+)